MRESGDAGPAQQNRRRHHGRGAAAFLADARPASAADHARPRQAPARLRQGGRADRGGVVSGDRNPDRSRPDVQRQAPGIHPVLGYARGVDGGRPDQPPQTRRGDRIDGVRPVSSARRARIAGRRQHRPARQDRNPDPGQRPGSRPRRPADRGRAARCLADAVERALRFAGREPRAASCTCAAGSAPTPRGAI